MIFAIGVAVALTACVNNEQFDDAAPKEVSFKGFNLGESTRATFDGTEFMVYAQFSNAGDGSDYKNYWGNAPKEITEQDGAWKVNETTKYYWPKAGAISFWGYYPKSQAGVTFDTTNGVKVAGVNAAKAAVLMLADPAESKLKKANDVPMVFKHAGAQVIVRAANASVEDGFALTINSVAISEVMPTADYQWSGWSNWSGTKETISSTGKKNITNKDFSTPIDDLYTFNVIPQSKAQSGAQKKMTINYTVVDTNAGYSYNATATFDATDWLINTKHYYNVTFNFTAGEEIEFAPSTTEWATSGPADTDHDFAVTD